MTLAERYYYLLYTTLLVNCPYDTGNMKRHIKLVESGAGSFKIIVSAPLTVVSPSSNGIGSKKLTDYARHVNYGSKSGKNYHWIEKTCKQVAEIIGDEVNYEVQ